MRKVFFLAIALGVLASCSEPVSFPEQPPAPHLSMRTERKPEPPPVPKGVAQFQMDPETKPRIAMIVAISAIAFIVALLISLAMRAVDRLIPAGIGAAFLGPVVALLIAARRMAHILTGFAEGPFFFADFALAMWNDNQPLLIGLYCGSIILIIVLVIAAVTKTDSERGLATFMTLLFAMIAAVVSFASFISMNRLVLAMLDPIRTDTASNTAIDFFRRRSSSDAGAHDHDAVGCRDHHRHLASHAPLRFCDAKNSRATADHALRVDRNALRGRGGPNVVRGSRGERADRTCARHDPDALGERSIREKPYQRGELAGPVDSISK